MGTTTSAAYSVRSSASPSPFRSLSPYKVILVSFVLFVLFVLVVFFVLFVRLVLFAFSSFLSFRPLSWLYVFLLFVLLFDRRYINVSCNCNLSFFVLFVLSVLFVLFHSLGMAELERSVSPLWHGPIFRGAKDKLPYTLVQIITPPLRIYFLVYISLLSMCSRSPAGSD